MAVRSSPTSAPCVLVADDYLPNLVVIEAILQPYEVGIVKATTAEEAVQWARKQRFSAILLDVRMADMGGIKAAIHIRADRKNDRTPIVFLTGAEPDQRELEELLGPKCEVLLKPFTASALLGKVIPLLDSKPERSGTHTRPVGDLVAAAPGRSRVGGHSDR